MRRVALVLVALVVVLGALIAGLKKTRLAFQTVSAVRSSSISAR